MFTEEYNSHFYHVAPHRANYCSAEKYCADRGARLVARNLSTAWQFFVMKGLDATRLWIGVTDFLHERNYSRSGWQLLWGSDSDTTLASDSQFIENNWQNNQPNNYEKEQHCSYYYKGKIYDSCYQQSSSKNKQ